ncbi:MAG: hypothetical protein PHX83_05100 [Acidobacteriia bacterium]|nr:hypothetical protein [Terriglobia bacterium]
MIVNEIYLVTVTDRKTNATDHYFCMNRSENIFVDIERLQNEYETRFKTTWRTDFKFEYRDVTKEFLKAVQATAAQAA